MKVYLESNFYLLGEDGNLESMELEGDGVTLGELLESLSRLSPDSPEFLSPRARDVSPGWIVKLNGNDLGLFNEGLDAVLKDGDRVVINLELICGG
jgi:molybdopterin converting factor small subunit